MGRKIGCTQNSVHKLGAPKIGRYISAQHLGAHIRQHGDLHAAGGWQRGTGMAQHYAGSCIESTQLWSRLMVQPVGLLAVGGHGVATPSFNM